MGQFFVLVIGVVSADRVDDIIRSSHLRSFVVQVTVVAGVLFLAGLVVWWAVHDRSSRAKPHEEPTRPSPADQDTWWSGG